MPSTASHSSSRKPVGVWQLTRSVSRSVAASYVASVERGSIGTRRDALVDEVERDDVRGARERRVGGGAIAVAHLAGDVVGRLRRRPPARRALWRQRSSTTAGSGS